MLHAQLARQVARGNLPVTVHQHDQALFLFIFQHDGLDDLMLRRLHFTGGLGRAAVLFVLVHVGNEVDAVRPEKAHGGGNGVVCFGHGGVS